MASNDIGSTIATAIGVEKGTDLIVGLINAKNKDEMDTFLIKHGILTQLYCTTTFEKRRYTYQ